MYVSKGVGACVGVVQAVVTRVLLSISLMRGQASYDSLAGLIQTQHDRMYNVCTHMYFP